MMLVHSDLRSEEGEGCWGRQGKDGPVPSQIDGIVMASG